MYFQPFLHTCILKQRSHEKEKANFKQVKRHQNPLGGLFGFRKSAPPTIILNKQYGARVKADVIGKVANRNPVIVQTNQSPL